MNEPNGTLDKREENQLIIKARRGDKQAMEELLKNYEPLIAAMASRFYVSLHSLLSREELMQSGYVGLMTAIRHFDPDRDIKLGTYSFSWILGEMRHAVKTSAGETGCYDQVLRLKREQAAFEQKRMRSPTVSELSQACGIPLWLTAMLLNLSAQKKDEGMYTNTARLNELEERENPYQRLEFRLGLESLPKDERRVIMLRYYRDQSQAETARTIGKSQTQVSRIERRAIDHLKQFLT